MFLRSVERASVALGSSALEIHLNDLVKKHADITAIANKDGREQVHAAAMVLRKQRTTIAAAGKGARDDAAAMQFLIPGWTFNNKRPCLVR